MKVFMLGWEFPPYISGGLGTACFGLTKGLDEVGVDVAFVLPHAIPVGAGASHVDLLTPTNLFAHEATWEEEVSQAFKHLQVHRLPATLQAYGSPKMSDQAIKKILAEQHKLTRKTLKTGKAGAASPTPAPLPSGTFAGGAGANYQGNLMDEVHRYARLAVELAAEEKFDVVHAHDWMTYPAGLAVAAATGKPLVVHVHSTEFDRSGDHINQQVYDIERAGMHGASSVVCVSHLTRNIVTGRYGVPPEKVCVVYNAVDVAPEIEISTEPIKQNEKIVLFLGRVTMQKGPEYFLQAAAKVVKKFPNVRFVMAGSGDMVTRMIRLAADLKIGRYVTFTGFLRGDDVTKVFKMADLYVMPSVSEPFGIAPLEALSHNVPVIISKQSGVSEVLTHVLKVDFWDINEMANKILAVLRHAPLQKTLSQHGQIELRKLSWRDSAAKLKGIYERLAGVAV
jgi:glycosyltransferase involved in cell wall biosynthesis